MHNNVVILEAGIGAMSIAFEMEGFQVIEAYEEDKKAIEIYRKNLETTIKEYKLMDLKPFDISDMDVLAGQIFESGFRSIRSKEWHNERLSKFIEIVCIKRPKIFLMVMNRGLFFHKTFRHVMEQLIQENYNVYYQCYDVQKVTGIPVKENCYCVIGIRGDIPKRFELMSDSSKKLMPITEFCNKEQVEGRYYYNIPYAKIESIGTQDSFLCWEKNRYIEKDVVSWNIHAMPFVRINGRIRRITHDEILHLKGFPYSFSIQNDNKSQMYRMLIYSPNVIMMRVIAKSLMYIIDEYSIRDSQAVGALNFEKIFGEYLYRKTGKVFDKAADNDALADYTCEYYDIKVFFRLKFYKYNSGVSAKIVQVCKEMHEKILFQKDEVFVVVFGNIVSEVVKQKCLKEFGIIVWDVKNLLWIFEDYADIRNDFVAMLNYSVKELLPQKPQLQIEQSHVLEDEHIKVTLQSEQKETNTHGGREKSETGRELKKKLSQIETGNSSFSDYEKVCIEILKYVFADYLTLWAIQEKSNAGLYRFDLCCKIKNDTNQDFFNMLMTYFNSKYVVIEFKNYEEKITQKEIYTTEKYLYEKALRRVAILISRKGPDENAIIALKGCLRENGKLIMCLSDDDLLNLIDVRDKNERSPAEYLEDMLDELLIHLEK